MKTGTEWLRMITEYFSRWLCFVETHPKCTVYFCLTALNTTCNNIDEFECGNGDCINYTLTCDGRAHCKDKSDEKQSYCCKWKCCHWNTQKAVFLLLLTFVIWLWITWSGSQQTVCVRRDTEGVWMIVALGTAHGAMGRTTAGTTLMKSSVTVSHQTGLLHPHAVFWYFQMKTDSKVNSSFLFQPHFAQPISSSAEMEAVSRTPASVTRRWTVRTPVMKWTAVSSGWSNWFRVTSSSWLRC